MLAALLLAVAAPLFADCPLAKPVIVGNTQGYVMMLGETCFVSIDPAYTPDLVYRSYAIFDDGLFMVFNSYGDGQDIGRLTGAREFMFFPRRSPLRLDVGDKFVATLPNGDTMTFDPASGQVSALGRGAVAVAAAVSPDNQGGLEITRYDGLLLDLGFARGHAPNDRPENQAVFRDAEGQACSVKMKEIYDYAPDGEHEFKFTDVRLLNWLHFRCPFLKPGFTAPTDPLRSAKKPVAAAARPPYTALLKTRAR